MTHNRRNFIRNTIGFALAVKFTELNFKEQKKSRIILLGTKGGPRIIRGGRKNASVLLLINNAAYIIDCGYGTTYQLLEAGIPLDKTRYIFITHHHSDHTLDYGPLIYNAWMTGQPVKIDSYGPQGLTEMTDAFFRSQKLDIDVRIKDEGRPDIRKFVFPHDINDNLVLKNDDVKVTAVKVRHPEVENAYAYRFETSDRTIVISGDTTYSPELIQLAKGADVLLHEAMYVPALDKLLTRVPNAARFKEHLLASHTTTDDVGRVAAEAGVKKLVLYHFVPGDDPSITDEMWTEAIRKNFHGEIIVGKDLMEL